MDWSHDLLAGPERALFARLAVFAGGWTLEAAEAVGAGDGIEPGDVLDLLTRLVDKSLVVADEQPDGTARYRLLETLRQYAQEQLAAAAGGRAVRARHRDWCLALAGGGEPGASRFQQRGRPAARPEQDNLRAALAWGAGGPPGRRPGAGRRPPAGLWHARGRHEEGARWLEAYLARVPAAEARRAAGRAALRASALYWLGRLVREVGETERARAPLAEALALFRQAGDDEGAAATLEQLALVARADDRPEEARRRLEEALALHQRAGRLEAVVWVRRELGNLSFALGDLPRARAAFEESVAFFRAARPGGDPIALARLGIIAQREGDPARARRLLEEALAELRRHDYRWGIYIALAALGDLAAAEGDAGGARARYSQIVAEARARAFDVDWQLGLVGLGLLAVGGGDAPAGRPPARRPLPRRPHAQAHARPVRRAPRRGRAGRVPGRAGRRHLRGHRAGGPGHAPARARRRRAGRKPDAA